MNEAASQESASFGVKEGGRSEYTVLTPAPGSSTPLVSSGRKQSETEVELVSPTDATPGGASLKGAVFNLVNSTIGTGVLGLPLVFKDCGLVLGFIFLIAFALLAAYTLILLHKCSQILINRNDERYISSKSYEDIGQVVNGRWGAFFVKLCVICINFGGCLSFQIIIGDLLLSSIGERIRGDDNDDIKYIWLERPFVVGAIALLLLFPLSIIERMHSLRFISLLSLLTVIGFILVVVIYYFVEGETHQEGDLHLFRFDISIFKVLSICTFAYSCHTNILPISKDFKDPSNIDKAVLWSVTIVWTSYSFMASFGYLTFYDGTEGNILLSYPEKDVVIDIIKVLMAMSVILTFPTVTYPCRLSLDNLLFPDKEVAVHPRLQVLLDRPRLRLNLLTAIIIFISYLFSILLPSVSTVFGLTGSTASTFTSYLLPGWFYLRLRGYSWFDRRAIPLVLLLIFGLVFGTMSTVVIIVGLFIDI
jgi:amino acid permease